MFLMGALGEVRLPVDVRKLSSAPCFPENQCTVDTRSGFTRDILISLFRRNILFSNRSTYIVHLLGCRTLQ